MLRRRPVSSISRVRPRKEPAKAQVTANAVCPGFIVFAMTADFPKVRRAQLEKIPLGRAGSPSDVANVVAFLASDDAA